VNNVVTSEMYGGSTLVIMGLFININTPWSSSVIQSCWSPFEVLQTPL